MNPNIDIDAAASDLGPPPERRRGRKYWEPYAWATRALVERGYGATEAARAVLSRSTTEEPTEKNVACLRVVYYKIRKLMWPEDMKHLRGNVKGPTLEESPEPKNPRVEKMMDEGFEV